METRWIFRPSKLHRKKYVETTWIFPPSKLHREKYVETIWIFRSEKLHWKSTWKQCGNSSKFGLWHIDVLSTSNRRRFDVMCPLGTPFFYRYLFLKNNDMKTLIFWCIFEMCTKSSFIESNTVYYAIDIWIMLLFRHISWFLWVCDITLLQAIFSLK